MVIKMPSVTTGTRSVCPVCPSNWPSVLGIYYAIQSRQKKTTEKTNLNANRMHRSVATITWISSFETMGRLKRIHVRGTLVCCKGGARNKPLHGLCFLYKSQMWWSLTQCLGTGRTAECVGHFGHPKAPQMERSVQKKLKQSTRRGRPDFLWRSSRWTSNQCSISTLSNIDLSLIVKTISANSLHHIDDPPKRVIIVSLSFIIFVRRYR